MPESIKVFFDKIINDDDILLFWKLYHNPSDILGDKQDMDEAEEEYKNLFNYCQLMMNNKLTEFVKLVLADDNFSKKVDFQIWRKLHFFLYDSVEFKKHYHLLDDRDLMELFEEKITVYDYLDKKKLPNTFLSLLKISSKYDIYKQYIRLYQHKYPLKQIENYDEKEAKRIRGMVTLRMQAIYEKTIVKQNNKNNALKQVEEDDYSENSDHDNTYLYSYQLISDFIEPYSLFPGICLEVLDNLVCENKFLDIIERKLNNGTITGIPLDNAIKIIDMGIKIRTYEEQNAIEFRKILGENFVKQFDLDKAKSLISKLKTYRKKTKNLAQIITLKK